MLENKLEEDWSYKKAIFRYGMPCIEDRRKLGIISEADYGELYSYKGRENNIPEELLLKHFKLVIDGVKEKTGEGVDDYFMGSHNHKINSREGVFSDYPKSFCELCVSRDATVKKCLGKNNYLVDGDGYGTMKVSGEHLPSSVKPEKRVRVHRGYIVKEIS